MTLNSQAMQIQVNRTREQAARSLQIAQGGGLSEINDNESSMLRGEDAEKSLEIFTKVKEKYGQQLSTQVQREAAVKSLSEYIVNQKLGGDQKFLTDPSHRATSPEDFTNGQLNERGRYKAALRCVMDNIPINRSDDPEKKVDFGTFWHTGSEMLIGPGLRNGSNKARDVLAFMWTAVSDPNIEFIEGEEEKMGGREICQEAEKENFVTTLAAIQRAHNDGSYAAVDRLLDNPSCDAGTWGRTFKEGTIANKMTQFYQKKEKEEKLKSPADQFIFDIIPKINEAFRSLSPSQQLELMNNFHGSYLSAEGFSFMKGYTLTDFTESLLEHFDNRMENYWNDLVENNPVLKEMKMKADQWLPTRMGYRHALEEHKKYYKRLWRLEIQKMAEGNLHQQYYYEPFEQHLIKSQLNKPREKALSEVESHVENEKKQLEVVIQKLTSLRSEIRILQKNINDNKGDSKKIESFQKQLSILSLQYENIIREKNDLIKRIENKAKELTARHFISEMDLLNQEHADRKEEYVKRVVPPIEPIQDVIEEEFEGELNESDEEILSQTTQQTEERKVEEEQQIGEEKPKKIEAVEPSQMQKSMLTQAYKFFDNEERWPADAGERTKENQAIQAIIRAQRIYKHLNFKEGHFEWFRQQNGIQAVKQTTTPVEEKKEEPLSPAQKMQKELQQAKEQILYDEDERKFLNAVHDAYIDPNRTTTNIDVIIFNALQKSKFSIPKKKEQHFSQLGKRQVHYDAAMKRIHSEDPTLLKEGILYLVQAAEEGSWEATFELDVRMKYDASFKESCEKNISSEKFSHLKERIEHAKKIPQIYALYQKEVEAINKRYSQGEINEDLREMEIKVAKTKADLLCSCEDSNSLSIVADAYIKALVHAQMFGSISAKYTLACITLNDDRNPDLELASPLTKKLFSETVKSLHGFLNFNYNAVIRLEEIAKTSNDSAVKSNIDNLLKKTGERLYKSYRETPDVGDLVTAGRAGHSLAQLEVIQGVLNDVRNVRNNSGFYPAYAYKEIFGKDPSVNLKDLLLQVKEIADNSDDIQVEKKAREIITQVITPMLKEANEHLQNAYRPQYIPHSNMAEEYRQKANDIYEQIEEFGVYLSHDFHLDSPLQKGLDNMIINPPWLISLEAQLEDYEENIRLDAGGVQYQLTQDKLPIIQKALEGFVNAQSPQQMVDAVNKYLKIEEGYFALLDGDVIDEELMTKKLAEVQNAKNAINIEIRAQQEKFKSSNKFDFQLTATDNDYIDKFLATTYRGGRYNPSLLVQRADDILDRQSKGTNVLAKTHQELQEAIRKLTTVISETKTQVKESMEADKISRATKQHKALTVAETNLQEVQAALSSSQNKGRGYYQAQAERALEISNKLDQNLTSIGPIKRTSSAINTFKSVVNKIFGWLGVELKKDKTLSKKEIKAIKQASTIKEVMEHRKPEQQQTRQQMLFMESTMEKRLKFSEKDIQDAVTYINTHLNTKDLNLNIAGLKEFLQLGVNAQIKQFHQEPIIVEFKTLDGSKSMPVNVSKYLFEQYIKKQREIESITSTPPQKRQSGPPKN